jgi:glycosyl hydrolase family 108
MVENIDVGLLIDGLIDREGGYSNQPADKGGPTCFGITEAVARANGYRGAMRQLPREEAAAIYKRLYWLRPRFDQVALRSPRLAAELFDTGANMGPAVAATFLQRALTALNRNGRDYSDLVPTGASASRRSQRSTHSSPRAGEPAGKRCCFEHSRRFRASATSASPSADPPMRPSSMVGSRTESVNGERQKSQSGGSGRPPDSTPLSLIRG